MLPEMSVLSKSQTTAITVWLKGPAMRPRVRAVNGGCSLAGSVNASEWADGPGGARRASCGAWRRASSDDHLRTFGANADVRDRHPRQRLQPLDICLRRLREIGPGAAGGRIGQPSGELFVHGLQPLIDR